MKELWTVMALSLALAAQTAGPAEVLLEAAKKKELLSGDLEGAIRQYKEIVAKHGRNRAAVAQALVRMGQCYEKLGDAEARKAYERVLASYADQREAAAEARTRLAALGGMSGGEAVARRVWTGPETDGTGTPSADGRYLSYVHWDTGDLAIRDLTTGQNRLVTNKGPWDKSSQLADLNVLSPDGKLLAYSWMAEGGPKWVYELRVSATDGSGMKILYRGRPQEYWGRPYAITPDNQYVLIALEHAGPPRTTRIVLVAVADGSVRDLKKIETGGYRDRLVLSPDGRFVAYTHAAGKTPGERNIYVLPAGGGGEIPLVTDPSDDYVLGWAPDGKSILFASNRSGTNDAWLLPVENGKAVGPPRLAKQRIGPAWPMGFTADGTFYYGARSSSGDMYLVTLDPATGRPTGEPTLVLDRRLGANGPGFFSPDGKWLAYRFGAPGWGQKLAIRSLETGQEREIETPWRGFPLWGWHPDGRSLLVAQARGAYRVDLESGQASLLFGDRESKDVQMQNLAWAHDGKTIYYRRNEPKVRRLMAHNVETGEEKELFRYQHVNGYDPALAVSPDGRWLALSERGPLLVMPAEGGEPRVVVPGPKDATRGPRSITWSADGRFLYYFAGDNKLTHLFRVAVEGGQPENLEVRGENVVLMSAHPDGRRILYDTLRNASEVWVLEKLFGSRR